MDLLDRLLGHDTWTTRQLLGLCRTLTDDDLDREFDLGHQTIRKTLDHLIWNMEIWTQLMSGEKTEERSRDLSLDGIVRRFDLAESRLGSIARRVADDGAWDDVWVDHLEQPPQEKSYGSAIAHLITHSMHHRAQLLYLFRLSGVEDIPEGDVFSWEKQAGV